MTMPTDNKPVASRQDPAAGGRKPTIRFATTHGVVPALDIDTPDVVKRVVEQTTRIEGVVGYKLGLTLTLKLGLANAVRELRSVTDLPILYDHQKAGPDVGDMAGKFAATAAVAGVDGVVLFPLAGPRAVDAFVGSALEHGLVPVVGGDLPLSDYNQSGGGYVVDNALDLIFDRAIASGADHFIIPGKTPDKVRHHAERLPGKVARPRLFIPGIGALGGSIADTFAAARGCHTYAIVGRAVYDSRDPGEAARRLAEEALGFA
jgi:orotidine-5'-phosphate decarboxylase